MLENLFFCLITILACLSFFQKSGNKLMLALCALLMAYIFAFNTNNNDYDSYFYLYESQKLGHVEDINGDNATSPLFSYSMIATKLIGADFNFYRLIMFVTLLAPIYVLFRKYAEIGVLLAGYGFVIFFFDLVQIRFAFAEYLFFIALYYLNQGKKLLYLGIIATAVLVHSMVIPFALFALLPNTENLVKKLSKFAPYVIVGVVIAAIAGQSVIFYLQEVVAMISLFDEYSHKMEQVVRYGYLLYIIYQAANIYVARTCYNKRHLIESSSNDFQIEFNRLNYMIQLVGFLFVIPAMININFGRFIRVMLIINLLNMAMFVYATKKHTIKKIARLRIQQCLNFSMLTILWIIGETYINGSYPNILDYVFTSLSK